MLDSEPENLIRLRIAGNGTLLASRSHRVLALLHQGNMSLPVAADEASLAQLVARSLGKPDTMETRANDFARLIRVVTTMISHGHGGAPVLVPAGDDSWRKAVEFQYSFDAESAKLLVTCPPKPGPGIMLEFLTKEDGIWPGKDEHQNRL
jgi:hypothetical protein